MPHNIAQRIKQRRKDLAMSQDDLAKACSVGQSTVANWESGSHIPRQATLTKIATALSTDDVWLLSGEHAKTRNSLNAYLQKSIRHVPIFGWPHRGDSLDEILPNTYFPISSKHKNLFALSLDTKLDDFKAGTLLVFTRDKTRELTSYVLNNSPQGYKLEADISEDTVAHLLYSIAQH